MLNRNLGGVASEAEIGYSRGDLLPCRLAQDEAMY